MSLITLRSQNDSLSGSVVESSAYIRNYFKESIEFNPGDTFELVSISITKTDKFEIIAGTNDRFIWRIGQGPTSLTDRSPTFSQHQVIIPAGSYNGQQLALIIQNELNRGVILQNYAPPLNDDVTQGGFQVIYSENTTVSPPVPASFQITYTQSATPVQNAETLTITKFLDTTNILTVSQDIGINNGWLLSVDPSKYQNGRNLTTLSTGVYGNKSTFPNGGEVSVDISPSLILQDIAGFTGLVKVIDYDTGGGESDIDLTITPIAPVNSWQYRLEFQDEIAGKIESFKLYNGGTAGQVLESILGGAGTGYAVNESGTFTTTGSGILLNYTINSVSSPGGAILTYTLTTQGENYAVNDIASFGLPAGGGTQADIEITRIQTGGGTDYSVGDRVHLSNPSGVDRLIITVNTIDAFGGILTYTPDASLPAGENYTAGSISNGINVIGASIGYGSEFEIETVTDGITLKYGALTDDGFLGTSLVNTADATVEANWTAGKWTYNSLTTKLTSSSGTASDTNPHGKIQTTGGGGFAPTAVPGIYNRVTFGLARNILISGIDNYPSNIDAQLQALPKGFDIQFSISSDDANSDIQLECTGFVKTPGATYPNSNWRTLKEYIKLTDNVRSSNWNNTLGQAPANWTTFNYGTDHIRVRMERYGVDKTRVFISHDNAGDQAYAEEVRVLQQATPSSTTGADFSPVTIENYYPFHPCVFTSKGTRFGNNDVKIRGIYDPRVIDGSQANIVSTTFSGNLRSKNNIVQMVTDEETHIQDYTLTGLPHLNVAAPLSQSSMWKWGIVDESETNDDFPSTYNAAGEGGPNIQDAQGIDTQLSGRSLSPNNGANATGLLGFERWNTYQAGLTQTIKTSANNTPSTNLLEPSLMVEFPDFNIKSYSGESSDSCKAISVIPREQWTTDSKTGTLMYVSNYPIPIDLNISNKQQLNQLTCRLRQMDGTMADDLLHPTELTIRKRRGFNPNM